MINAAIISRFQLQIHRKKAKEGGNSHNKTNEDDSIQDTVGEEPTLEKIKHKTEYVQDEVVTSTKTRNDRKQESKIEETGKSINITDKKNIAEKVARSNAKVQKKPATPTVTRILLQSDDVSSQLIRGRKGQNVTHSGVLLKGVIEKVKSFKMSQQLKKMEFTGIDEANYSKLPKSRRRNVK